MSPVHDPPLFEFVEYPTSLSISLAKETFLPIPDLRSDHRHGCHLQSAEAIPEKAKIHQLLDEKEHGTTEARAAVTRFQCVSSGPTFIP